MRNQYGSSSVLKRSAYKTRKINKEELLKVLESCFDVALLELVQEFDCSVPVIYCYLRRIGITRKKTSLYAERNEEKITAFIAEIRALDPWKIVYLDESGIDVSLHREYARSRW